MAMSFSLNSCWILVPQGAEYQSVKQGLGSAFLPSIYPIPVGSNAVKESLLTGDLAEKLKESSPQLVIVMGLAGSLSSRLKLGQVVVYRSCQYLTIQGRLQQWLCDISSLNFLAGHLYLESVDGLNSDRVITSSKEKQELGERYQVQAVDMESAAILDFFETKQIPVIIVRVISDEVGQSLPDFSQVYNAQGELRNWPLAKALITQPIAGIKLIKSSLYALNKLEKIATKLSSLVK